MAVQPIPTGQDCAIPYLCIKGAAKALEFYPKALGAVELFRMDMPGGMIGHAEIKIGNARVMLADEFPEYGVLGPESIGGSPVTIHVYVEDIDSFADKAVAAGMKVIQPVATQFYGDRSGKFQDPFGHVWSFATHVEDVSHEEMMKRAAVLFGSGGV